MAPRLLIIGLCLVSWFPACWSHSTASELAELSLDDLLEMPFESLGEVVVEDQAGAARRWRFTQSVFSKTLVGYRRGSRNLSDEAVLFRPGEIRTAANYPVLPRRIQQGVYSSSLSYLLSPRDTLSIGVPYIRQSTDHISIVPGYPRFVIDSQGIGDVLVSWRRQLPRTTDSSWSLAVGVSLPTGSISEQGDTPRAPGDQPLPYTMQLGSGTYDLQLGVGFRKMYSRWNLGLETAYRQRLGENERDYRLGNKFSLAARADLRLRKRLGASLGISYQASGSIRGQDDEITVAGPFPYPASITDPDNFGGRTLGLDASLNYQLSAKQKLTLNYGRNIVEDLNGIQPQEQARWSIGWTIGFGGD